MSGHRTCLPRVVVGCTLAFGCAGADKPAAPTLPTWTAVTQQVITQKNCGGPLCHSLTAGGFRLGSSDALYSALVGQKASGAKCGPAGMRPDASSTMNPLDLVVPGDPEQSLLYMKLRYNPPCGDGMPATTPLDDAKVILVRDWIEAGAKKD